MPAERMKVYREHRVPLPKRALEVLTRAAELNDESGLVFPGMRPVRPLSENPHAKFLRELGFDAITHRFRSSFRDYPAERTHTPHAVKAHFRALPWAEVGAAVDDVRQASGVSESSRLCLEFLVLTAARSGEALGAAWDEIDFAAREWRIPAERMKTGVAHAVPLSDAALRTLEAARALGGERLVFPSPGAPFAAVRARRKDTRLPRHRRGAH